MTIPSPARTQINSGNIQVGFVPFITSNSYQAQLISKLSMLGPSVSELDADAYFLPVVAWKMKLKVVHIHWLDTFYLGKNIFRSYLKLAVFIIGLILLRLTNVKIIWTVHNLKRHESINPRLENICTAAVVYFSNRLIAHCDIAKVKVLESFSLLSSDKIVVIPHGNYIGQYENGIKQKEARRTLGISESSFVFLFLGQVRPYKGVLDLIEAFKRLEDSDNASLIIAGKVVKDSVGQEIRKRASDSNRIHLSLLNIEDEKIQLYMNCADIVVFPYRNVLTSGAVILAMSFAKPCIASKVGCIENTLDLDGAYLYEPDDQNGLFNSMTKALNERARMKKMGQHNYKTVEQWDWGTLAQKTNDVYQDSTRKR